MRRESEFRYSKLANILREQILSGYIKPGEFLLSENELCKHYGMSRTSVRKSLDQLFKEGLIIKKVGQGTIVSPDLVIPESKRKVLRILATSPSHFADNCMQYIIDAFQRKHPHVDVKLLSFPVVDFWESIRASSELGLQADIIFVTDQQYIESDAVDSFIDLREPLQTSFTDTYPRMLNSFSRDHAVTAAPVTFSTVYLAYNPDLFDKYHVARPDPNWTKEDFVRAAQKLTVDTDGDGIVDQYGLSMSAAFSRWPVFALQNGVNFNNATSREAILQTFMFIHDLLYRYRIATLSPRYQLNSEAFVREKAAMVLTTSIELAGWRNENLQFEPQIAALPFGDLKATLLVANAFMVPAGCSDQELAIQFLQTAFDPEVQETIGRNARFLSVLKPVNEKLWDKSSLEMLNIVNDRIENSFFLHEVFKDPNIIEELDAEMGLYWAGLESAPAFTERVLRMIAADPETK